MEFKGTRVEFYVDVVEKNDSGGVLCVKHNLKYNKKEMPFNALLISKSLQLLEKLNECAEFLNKVKSPAKEALNLRNEILELITESTEIK